jgi:hypothetical protein
MADVLEDLMKRMEKCPICEAADSFKISGFIGKNIECNSCKAKWSGGVDPDGVKWLWLQKPSKNGVGKYIMKRNRPFALEFWTDENPF